MLKAYGPSCATSRSSRSILGLAAFAGLFYLLAPSCNLSGATSAQCTDAAIWQKRAEIAEASLKDWAGLGFYRKANAQLPHPVKGQRVVFMGDSILGFWYPPPLEKPYMNRAIAGQSTAQMLVRFRADVVALKPKVVVMMGGTNDLRWSVQEVETVKDNLSSMSEIARANGIRVVLGSLPPPAQASDEALIRATQKLNTWVGDYSSRNGDYFADFYSVLVSEKGGFKPELTSDGLHPNAKGYQTMAPLLRSAVEQALRER